MSKLRRYYSDGHLYFVTVVTHQRQKILVKYADNLMDTINKLEADLEFDNIAYVIMPDHLHMIIDPGENNLSNIIGRIKLSFSKKIRYLSGKSAGQIWQSRFWDHMIRNQEDLNRHIDYIHYNPVKHGITESPFDWQESSIHDYFKSGYYSKDWGLSKVLIFKEGYGE